MTQVAPSLLAADLANIQGEIQKISNADMLHIDVMDGKFVPNITMGIPVVESIKKITNMTLDVHLMIECPERYIEDFIKAGADRVTIHVESDTPSGLQRAFDLMEKHGVDKGLALRPITKLSAAVPFLSQLQNLLIMTVEPGFGGQKFMEQQVAVIEEAVPLISQYPDCLIQVDGGINVATAAVVRKAGASILVAGSSVYGASDPQAMIEAIRCAE